MTNSTALMIARNAVNKALLLEYGIGLSLFLLALLGRLLLDTVLPFRLPFITFFLAVLLTAYRCSLGPSIMVVLLGGAAGTLWVDPPHGSSPAAAYAVAFTLFALISALLVYLLDQLKTAQAKVAAHEAQLELINGELKHRIHNLFAITMSVFQQTLREGGSRDEIMQAVGGRISALAAAENLLSLSSKAGAELGELIGRVVNPLTPSPARLIAICPKLAISAEHATPFALILNELATNALKYGAWSNDTGYVGITCDKTAGNLIFQWHEHDGPPVSPSGKEGLGSKLIRLGLPNAQVDHALKPDGVVCRIELAIPADPKVEVSTNSPIEATSIAKRQAS